MNSKYKNKLEKSKYNQLKTFLIEEDLNEEVKIVAYLIKKSESSLIRDAVDQYIEPYRALLAEDDNL